MTDLVFMKRIALAWIILILAGVEVLGQEPFLRSGFSRQLVADGFTMAVGITFDEQGRGYIWDKGGRIYLMIDGEIQPELFIDIREEVANTGDNGMLGFVLDPDFYSNGYFYLFYTVDRHHLDHFGKTTYDPNKNRFWAATVARLTRFTADPATGYSTTLPGSRKVLFGETRANGAPVMYVSHGAADLTFGEDGTLLIAPGEGAPWNGASNGSGNPWYGWEAEGVSGDFYPEEQNVGSFRAQLLENAAGKVLRIDPNTGEGVPGNPFYDPSDPNSVQSKVWTLGLRNPFRLALRPGTGVRDPAAANPGTLYIGDVSGGVWEEVNIQRVGGVNYGWPLYDDERALGVFHSRDTFNQYAPNPLAAQPGCEDYFRFGDLLKLAGESFVNPCDSTVAIPDEIPRYYSGRAGLKWFHTSDFLPPRLEMLGEDDNGLPLSVAVDDTASGVTGDTDQVYGNAIVGGAFYDGNSFPEHFKGAYFLADHLGWIKAFHFNLNDSLTHIDNIWEDTTKIVDLAVNPDDGCLYVMEYPDRLYRICYGLNLPPVGVIDLDRQYGPGPLSVQFSAENSYDPDQDSYTIHWDFGDDSSSTEVSPLHTFVPEGDGPQEFYLTLTLTDSTGNVSKESVSISVNNSPPTVTILTPDDGGFLPQQGSSWVELMAEVEDQESSSGALQYAWQEILHHNTHFHEEPVDTNRITDLVLAELPCGPEVYYYQVRLTVSDQYGLSGTDQVFLYPDCVEPFVSLADLTVGGSLERSTLEWIIDSERDLKEIEIQWSPDEREFRTIATVAGSDRSYDHLAAQAGGNYYRLKFVNLSGSAFYSQYESIFFLEDWMRLYPNPTSEMVIIETDATSGEYLAVSLYDVTGRKVLQQQYEISGNSKVNVALEGLVSGTYFYDIEDGIHRRRGKLLIR